MRPGTHENIAFVLDRPREVDFLHLGLHKFAVADHPLHDRLRSEAMHPKLNQFFGSMLTFVPNQQPNFEISYEDSVLVKEVCERTLGMSGMKGFLMEMFGDKHVARQLITGVRGH